MNFGRPSSVDAVAGVEGKLKRLEREDWWRWTTVIIVTLLLTSGVLALSWPGLERNLFEQAHLDLSVTGLCGIVLLLDVFAVYQQVVITRLRRRIAASIGMVTTLEMLRPAVQDNPGPRVLREFPRFCFDQRITVKAVVGGRESVIHGRTTDISDGGVGAVIASAVEVGTSGIVDINLGQDSKLLATVVVRHRRGFRHGFQFIGVTPSQLAAIHQACDGAVLFVGVPKNYAEA